MLSDEEKERILGLKEEGLTDYSIAKAINRDPKTVANFLKESDSTPPRDRIKRHRNREAIPVPDPSPELKHRRELSEAMDLEVSIEKKLGELRELKGTDDLAVRRKESQVKIAELNCREFQARRKLEQLSIEEREQKRRQQRRDRIEKIKSECIPPALANELPPTILLLVTSEIVTQLSKVDIDLFDDTELMALATIAKNKIFQNPSYADEVRYASIRAAFRTLDSYLRQLASSYNLTYDQFLKELSKQMLLQDPEGTGKLLLTMREFVHVVGTQQQRNEMERDFRRLLS
jgi:hypothetical protein